MMIFIFPLYNFCQVSKIRIPWCIERKRQLVPHHHFLLLPALKASPLNFFPAWFRGRCKCDYNLPIPDGFITHTHTKSFKKQQKETEAQKSKNKYNLMYLSFYHLWQFYKNQKNMDLISAISAKYKIESWCRLKHRVLLHPYKASFPQMRKRTQNKGRFLSLLKPSVSMPQGSLSNFPLTSGGVGKLRWVYWVQWECFH